MWAVGIMGGTFDPIHYGHLVAAEVARSHFGLSEVVFVPTGRPPHKEGAKVTDAEHRYLMTVLATATNPHFSVSRSEVDRPGPSYTVDTVADMRRTYGPDCGMFFITGADAVREMGTWHRPEELFAMCEVIAATRPGYPLGRLNLPDLGEEALAHIHFLEVPALAISSSDIRERVAGGSPIKYLVPESVEAYIEKRALYRTPNARERGGAAPGGPPGRSPNDPSPRR